jgi:hypothetical protein
VGRTFSLIRIAFVTSAVLCGGLILTGLLSVFSYRQHLEDGLEASYETYSSISALDSLLTTFSIFPFILIYVLLIVWTRKAYKISEAATVNQFERKFSRRMSVGAWFIPISNLFAPKRVISEIEQILDVGADSDASGLSWQSRPIRTSGTWWWALWITTNLTDRYLLPLTKETDAAGFTTVDSLYQFTALSGVSNVITIISLILGIGYLGHITRNAESVKRMQSLNEA